MPAERGNMTDHADIVREFLDGNNVEGVRSARAALDALVVERDEARAAYQREVEAFRALGGSNLMQAIARAEAAEAERHELKNKLAVQQNWQTLYEREKAEVARMKAMVVELCTDERGVCSIRAALGEDAWGSLDTLTGSTHRLEGGRNEAVPKISP